MSGQTVTIDGCGASDPDGDTITYLWTQTQGESITLTDRTSPTLSFVTSTVKQSTTLAFQLTVNEGSLSDKASVQFLVLPVSSTGLCDTVEEHNSLMLSCPSGQVIPEVAFASYGAPGGSCDSFNTGACNANALMSNGAF
jgi:hypothetical protein